MGFFHYKIKEFKGTKDQATQDQNNGSLGGERGNSEEEKRADGVSQEKETCPKHEAHIVYIKI